MKMLQPSPLRGAAADGEREPWSMDGFAPSRRAPAGAGGAL